MVKYRITANSNGDFTLTLKGIDNPIPLKAESINDVLNLFHSKRSWWRKLFKVPIADIYLMPRVYTENINLAKIRTWKFWKKSMVVYV